MQGFGLIGKINKEIQRCEAQDRLRKKGHRIEGLLMLPEVRVIGEFFGRRKAIKKNNFRV
jgi:hypothetical protein